MYQTSTFFYLPVSYGALLCNRDCLGSFSRTKEFDWPQSQVTGVISWIFQNDHMPVLLVVNPGLSPEFMPMR